MIYSHIPISSLFSDGDLDFTRGKAIVNMEIEALNLVGTPYEIKGVSKFRMQYNPSVIEDSETTANYAEHRGLGSQIPTYHYLQTTTSPITIPLVFTDSYDGPPHSSKDSMGNIVYNDFENLYGVVGWFKNLTHVVNEWKKPPFCRISFGKFNRFGVVTNVSSAKFISFYKNGDPRICEMSFTLVPNVLVVAGDRSFYKID